MAMNSDSSSASHNVKFRQSPRLNLNKVNFKNITVRSRRKQTFPLSHLIDRGDENLTDSEVTLFERPFQNKIYDTSIIENKTNSKSRNVTCEDELGLQVNSDDDVCMNYENSPKCTPKTCKTQRNFTNSKSNVYEKNNGTISNKNYDKVRTCVTCKKPFRTFAEVPCDSYGNEGLQKIPCLRNELSEISDIERSSCFQPPYSSTRVYKTPVNSRLLEQPNLQLSGIKELERSLVNETDNDQWDSNPIELRIVPSINEIVPATNSDDENDNDDLPCTQPVTTILLRGIVAFVDVKIGNLKICDSLKQQLVSLGADVEEKFTRNVTHIIFKDGNLSTYKKAKRWKVPLVSLTWINDCASSLALLPTEKYVPAGLDKYEAKLGSNVEKDLFDINKKAKVYSSSKMKKMRSYLKKLESRNENVERLLPGLNTNAEAVTPEHEKSYKFNLIEEFINNLGGEVREMINRSESPQSSEDIHIPVPLSLLRKCITPRRAKTDVKALRPKISTNLRVSDRRKNLDKLLVSNKNGDLNKENVDSSGENLSERKSAPSELLTNYKQTSKNNRIRKRKENFAKCSEKKLEKNRRTDPVMDNNKNDINSQQLTQTSRKRQLLPLDQPVNDLISDTLNNSIEQIPVKNPYASPIRKCRKISVKKSSTKKKTFKEPTLRPVLRKIEEVSPGESTKENSDFSRRSSSVFFTTKKSTGKLKATKMTPTIVFTGLSQKSIETVTLIVEQLGTYVVESKVSHRTSHVVVERENFRTVNLLKGIIRGCWIVSIEWIYSSLEANKWISEEQFEVSSFSPAVRLNRYDRQAFGPEYSFELFNDCGPIFVSPKCNPPSEDIKELIKLSGGRLVNIQRAAVLVIGGKPSMTSRIPHVNERWVLDCISKALVLNHSEYLICSLRLS